MARTEEVLDIKTEAELAELDKAIDKIRETGDSLGDIADGADAIENSSDKASGGIGRFVSGVGGALTALGGFVAALGIITGLMAGVGSVTAWSDAMNLLEAQTGVTGEQLSEFKDIGQDLFTSGWGDGIDDITASLSQVRRITGENGEELKNLTENAIIMRDVFDKDIVESTRAADTMMEQFGVDGDRAFDLITRGLQLTGDPADDLLDTFNEYSANFSQMGFSAEGFMDLLNQGLQAGARNTDDIADAMREFQIRLLDGTSADAIQTLSKETQNLFGEFQNGDATAAQAFESIIADLNSMEDEVARNAAGVAIFGTKWEDMGADVLLALDPTSSALGEVEGATDRAGDAISRGIGPALERLKRTGMTLLSNFLEPYVLTLVDQAIPAMDTVAEWLRTDGVPLFEQFFSVIGDGVGFIATLGAVIIGALGGTDAILGSLGNAAGMVADMLEMAAGVLGSLSPESIVFIVAALAAMAAPAIIAGIGAVAVALLGMAASAFATMIAFAPLLAVMAIVIGLVAAYETNFGGLRDAIDSVGAAAAEGDIVGVFQGIGNALAAIPMGVADEILNAAGVEFSASEGLKAWGGVFENAKTIVDLLINEKLPALLGVNFTIPEGLSAWGGVFANAKTIVDLLINEKLPALLGVNFTIPEGLSAWGGIFDNAKAIIGVLIDEKLPALLNFAFSIPEGLAAWGGIFDNVQAIISTLINEKLPGLSSVEFSIPGALQTFADIFTTARDAISALVNEHLPGLSSVQITIPESLQNFANIFSNLFSINPETIAAQVNENILAPLSTALTTALLGEGGAEGGNILQQAVAGWGPAILTGIKNSLGSVKDWVMAEIIQPMVDALFENANAFIQAINDILPNSISFEASFNTPLGNVRHTISMDLPDNPIPAITRAAGGILGREGGFVGERGPEWFQPATAGRVIANHQLGSFFEGAGAGGGGGSITIPITLQLDGETIYETVQEIDRKRVK